MMPLFWFTVVGWGVGAVALVVSSLLPLRLKIRNALITLSVGTIIGVTAASFVWDFFINGLHYDPDHCRIYDDC
jgi:hypothetical protein